MLILILHYYIYIRFKIIINLSKNNKNFIKIVMKTKKIIKQQLIQQNLKLVDPYPRQNIFSILRRIHHHR